MTDIKRHVILFGDENNKDIDGEYFTPDTDFGDIEGKVVPVTYEFKHSIGAKATLSTDNAGIIADVKVHNESRVFNEVLEKQLRAGNLAIVTGASHAEIDEAGKIKQWEVNEVSITVTPSDLRLYQRGDT